MKNNNFPKKEHQQKAIPGSMPSKKNQKPVNRENNGVCGDKHQNRDANKDKNDTGKKPVQKKDCDECCKSLSESYQLTIYNDVCLYKQISL